MQEDKKTPLGNGWRPNTGCTTAAPRVGQTGDADRWHHKGMSRGRERQQMSAPKLCRSEGTPLSGIASEGKFAIDELIGDEIR